MKTKITKKNLKLLHFIFERELRPPFRQCDENRSDRRYYCNTNNEIIGVLNWHHNFIITIDPFLWNLKDKLCQAFGFLPHEWDWYHEVKPHLKSWLENKLNIKFSDIA